MIPNLKTIQARDGIAKRAWPILFEHAQRLGSSSMLLSEKYIMFAPYRVNSGYSCFSDEDFIGKVCRIGRRQSIATVAIRSLMVALLLYKQLWARDILR